MNVRVSDTNSAGDNKSGGRASVSQRSPPKLFELLANDTRFEIIERLWHHRKGVRQDVMTHGIDRSTSDEGLSFSALYDQVNYDGTGNFNYHLDKLTDHFLRQTETGYELTEAGLEIGRLFCADRKSVGVTDEPEPIDVYCPRCDVPLLVGYEENHVTIACTSCACTGEGTTTRDCTLFRLPFPSTGLSDRTPRSLFEAATEYTLHRLRSFIGGVCPTCSSPVEQTFTTHGGGPGSDSERIDIEHSCTRCEAGLCLPLGVVTLAHPTVTALDANHGIQSAVDAWEPFRRGLIAEETVIDEESQLIRLSIPSPTDELIVLLRLEESFSIIDVRCDVDGEPTSSGEPHPDEPIPAATGDLPSRQKRA